MTNVSKQSKNLKHTSSFIVKKNHTDASYVKNDFCMVVSCVLISFYTVAKQHLNAVHT